MIIKAEKTSFPEVIGAVDSFLEKNDCPMKTQFQIDTAVEEIFVNIASYAYPSGEGNADISISLSDDRILCIRFSWRSLTMQRSMGCLSMNDIRCWT